MCFRKWASYGDSSSSLISFSFSPGICSSRNRVFFLYLPSQQLDLSTSSEKSARPGDVKRIGPSVFLLLSVRLSVHLSVCPFIRLSVCTELICHIFCRRNLKFSIQVTFSFHLQSYYFCCDKTIVPNS